MHEKIDYCKNRSSILYVAGSKLCLESIGVKTFTESRLCKLDTYTQYFASSHMQGCKEIHAEKYVRYYYFKSTPVEKSFDADNHMFAELLI